MTRVSAKRMLVAAAGLALSLALGIAALETGHSSAMRFLGFGAVRWAVPLTVAAVIGLSAWMLLDGSMPENPSSLHAETVCPACGRVVLDDWRLCPHCGAFIASERERHAPARQ